MSGSTHNPACLSLEALNLAQLLQVASFFDDDDFVEDAPRGAKRPLEEDSEGDSEGPPGPESSLTVAGEKCGGVKKQSTSHVRRRLKRQCDRAEKGRQTRPIVIDENVHKDDGRQVNVEMKNLPAASCGYQAVQEQQPGEPETYTIPQLKENGYAEFEWDGL